MRIPNATYREAILLIAAVPVHVAEAVAHEPVPGDARTFLGRTPPVTAAAYEAERTIAGVTVATRKGRNEVTTAFVIPACFSPYNLL